MSTIENPFITVQQHIIAQQREHPTATGEFSWLLSAITLSTKIIASYVRRAGLIDVLGEAGSINVQGEVVQKLDLLANETLIRTLGSRGNVGIVASEEDNEPRVLQDISEGGKYIVMFDPLDGSSNIDANVAIGTIFTIFQRQPREKRAEQSVLQSGVKQIAAGYVVYGSSTILVYSVGNGVHGFTLEPALGAYVLSHENIRMPNQGKFYSVNEAYRDDMAEPYPEYIDLLRSGGTGRKYGSRYIGSLVADFHRTLLKGGVFIYPPTRDHANGKLRLMYEANPIAFIAEQAGGAATDGKQRILEVVPKDLHQRTPLVVGSKAEMEAFENVMQTVG